jgi:hypothetical protein
MLTPSMWRAAATVGQSGLWGGGPPWSFQFGFAPGGITSLAIIAIGLIVTWAGYIEGVSWTWFVMFAIVWVWAFPVLIVPYLKPWKGEPTIAQSFASSISRGGPVRNFVEVLLIFLLMVLALVLPAKTVFLGRAAGPGTPRRTCPGAPGEPAPPGI